MCVQNKIIQFVNNVTRQRGCNKTTWRGNMCNAASNRGACGINLSAVYRARIPYTLSSSRADDRSIKRNVNQRNAARAMRGIPTNENPSFVAAIRAIPFKARMSRAPPKRGDARESSAKIATPFNGCVYIYETK